MNGISLLAFISLLLLCYGSFRFSRLVYGDYLAPIGLFFGSNLAAISLYQLNLLPLVHVSSEAYALVGVSLFSFFIGSLMASPFFALNGRPLKRPDMLKRCVRISEGLSLFYYLTAIIGIAGWVFYVTVLVPSGWWSNLSMLQGKYVFPYHLGYTLAFSALVPPTFVLLALARRRVTFPSVCILAVNVITLGLCGIKTYLILGLATSLLVFSTACPNRIRLRHLIFAIVCLVGFMVLYDHFIDVFVPHQFPGSKFPDVLSFLERPYLYIVAPFSAMSVIIADPPEQAQWGLVTLLLVWKILGPGGLGIREWSVSKINPFVNIGPSDANVYTLIGEVYWDYGWIGTILMIFLLGFVSTSLYISARKHRNWILYLFSALISYGIFISFFLYYYRDTLIFLLLYTLIIGYAATTVSEVLKRVVLYRSHSQREYGKSKI